jgi:hypothetical protein
MIRGCLKYLLSFLKSYPDVNVVVKAHPRLRPDEIELLGPDGTLTPREDTVNISIEYNEVHTTSLIRWSDVVVDMGTSPAIEGIIRNKPTFHLGFLHGRDPVFRPHLPSVNLRSFDELHERLCQFRSGPVEPNYEPEERKRFIQENIVKPDEPHKPVLDCYVEFIDSLFDEQ